MLASVDRDGPLLGNACANTVRSFDRLGPHPAEPGSPVFKLACVGIVAAVFDGYTRGVAQQYRVPGFPNHLVKPIDLLLRAEDHLVERLTQLLELTGRKDTRRVPAVGVDTMAVCGTLPRC